jgi:hypothetical protein
MYIPTSVEPLSHPQMSKLLKGHAVRVKHGHGHQLHLSHQQHKKLMSAHSKGKGMNLMLDPYQIDMHGQGFLSSAMKSAKSVAGSKLGKQILKTGINAGAKLASNYIPPSVAQAVAHEASSHLVGHGLLSSAMKGVKSVAGSKLGKQILKTGINAGAQALGHSGYVPPSVASSLGHIATKAVGKGVHRRKKHHKKSHGGALYPAGMGVDVYEL